MVILLVAACWAQTLTAPVATVAATPREVIQTRAASEPLPPIERASINNAIVLSESSAEVRDLLFEGHFAIMGDQNRASFDKALTLFRQAVQKAHQRKEKKSEAAGRWLVSLTERAISRYREEQAQARRDANRGRFIYKDWGGPIPEEFIKRRQTVSQKYGVQYVGVAGCMASYEEIATVLGYNSVSVPAMEKRFGPQFWGILTGSTPIPDN